MIQITVNSDRIEARLKDMPVRVERSLLRVISAAALDLQRYIMKDKLEGQVLHHVSGNLQRSLLAIPAAVEGKSIVGRVVVDRAAWYGRLHEYGGTFQVRAHVRRTVSGKGGQVAAHSIRFPERSFMRSGLKDKASDISARIRAAVAEAVKGGQ